MPRYSDAREQVVDLPDTDVRYGFRTKIASADSTKFGHINVTATTTAVFGAQRPKPPRGKLKASGVSSFVATDKYNSQELSIIKNARRFPSGGSSTSKLLYVEVGDGTNKILYAWRRPADVDAKISDDAQLGVKAVTGTTKTFIGVNSMIVGGQKVGKPPRAYKVVTGGTGGVDRVSTFCSYPAPDTLPDGWNIVGG